MSDIEEDDRASLDYDEDDSPHSWDDNAEQPDDDENVIGRVDNEVQQSGAGMAESEMTTIISGSKLQGLGRARTVEERVTTRLMTKFERARILGARAQQIAMNAPVLVTVDGETDPLVIALKELREGVIPIMIRRILPDDSYEDWRVADMEVDFDRAADNRYSTQ